MVISRLEGCGWLRGWGMTGCLRAGVGFKGWSLEEETQMIGWSVGVGGIME